MKKLIYLLLTISLLACSAENEEETENRGTFKVPSLYWGRFEKPNTNYFLEVEEYKITFNRVAGDTIVVTSGMNLAITGDEGYAVELFNGEIVTVGLQSSGRKCRYIVDGEDLHLSESGGRMYYAAVD